MTRLIAIALLALLPLQFSWSAVASYCGHEVRADAAHFGHHEHDDHGDLAAETALAPDAVSMAVEAPISMEFDCGHCHGQISVMPMKAPALHASLSTARPGAAASAACGAQASTRPERPQWLPLA